MKFFKININLIFPTLLVLVQVFNSCEKELVIHTDEEDQLIVVNSMFNNSKQLTATVTQSFSPYGSSIIRELNKAKVSLSVNGILEENLTYHKFPGDTIGKFYSSIIPEPGKRYSIQVDADDLGIASSTSTLPAAVQLSSLTAQWVKWGEDTMNVIRYAFKFTLEDPDTANTYLLTISCPLYKLNEQSGEYEFYDYQYTEIITGDLPQHQVYLWNGLLFKDDSFNGNNYTVSGTATMYVYPFCMDFSGQCDLIINKSKLYIHLENLTAEAYNFHSSYAKKLKAQNDMYSEPSIVYSNIKKGVGIFAGAGTTDKQVVIKY